MPGLPRGSARLSDDLGCRYRSICFSKVMLIVLELLLGLGPSHWRWFDQGNEPHAERLGVSHPLFAAMDVATAFSYRYLLGR